MPDTQPQTTPPVQLKAPVLPDFVTPVQDTAPFDILRNYPGEDKNTWQARYQDIIRRTPSPIYPARVERGYFEQGLPPPSAMDVLSSSYQLAASGLAIDSFYKNVVDPNFIGGSNYKVDTNKFFSGTELNDLMKQPGGSYVYSQYRSQQYPAQMKSDDFYAAIQHDLERGRLLDTVGRATGFSGWAAQFTGQMLDPGTFLAAVATGGLAEAALPIRAAVAGEAAQGVRASGFLRSLAVTEAGAAGAFVPMEAAAQALDPNRQIGQSIEDFGTILGVGAIVHTATYAGVRAFVRPTAKTVETPKPSEIANTDLSFTPTTQIVGLSDALKVPFTPADIQSHIDVLKQHGAAPDIVSQIDALVAQMESKNTQSSVASVPVMITKKMEIDLRAMGFTDDQINKMTPSQAWDHINKTSDLKSQLDSLINEATKSTQATVSDLTPEQQVMAAHIEFTNKIANLINIFEVKSEAGLDPVLTRTKQMLSDFSVDFASGTVTPEQALKNLTVNIESLKTEFPDKASRVRTLVNRIKTYASDFTDSIGGSAPVETGFKTGTDIDPALREAMHQAMMDLIPKTPKGSQQVVEFEFTPHKDPQGNVKGYTFEQIGNPDVFGRNPTSKVMWTGDGFEVVDPMTGEPVSAEVKALPIDDIPDPVRTTNVKPEEVVAQETKATIGDYYEPSKTEQILGHLGDLAKQVATGSHPFNAVRNVIGKIFETLKLHPAVGVTLGIVGSPVISRVFGGIHGVMSAILQPGSNVSNTDMSIDSIPFKSLPANERYHLLKGYLDQMGNPGLFKALVNLTAMLSEKDKTDEKLNALMAKLKTHYQDGQVIPIEFMQGFSMDALNYIQDKYGSQIDPMIRSEYVKASKQYQLDKQADQVKASAAISMAPAIPGLLTAGDMASFAAQNPESKALLLDLIPAIEETMKNPLLGCSDNYAANIEAFVKEVQARSPDSANLWFAMIDETAMSMQKVGSTQIAGDLDGKGVSFISQITLGVLGNSLVRIIESAAGGKWGSEKQNLHADPVNWLVKSAQDSTVDFKVKSRLVTRLENVLNPLEQTQLQGLYMPKESHDLAVFLAAGEKMSDIARNTRFGNDLSVDDIRFIRGMMATHDLLAFSNHAREMSRAFLQNNEPNKDMVNALPQPPQSKLFDSGVRALADELLSKPSVDNRSYMEKNSKKTLNVPLDTLHRTEMYLNNPELMKYKTQLPTNIDSDLLRRNR